MEAHGLWFPAEIGHVLNLDSTTRSKVGHLEIGNGLETGSWPNPAVELVGVVKRAPKLFQWDGNDDLNIHVSCKIRRQRFRKQLETGRRGLEAASNFASHFASTVPLSGSPVGGAQTPRHLPFSTEMKSGSQSDARNRSVRPRRRRRCFPLSSARKLCHDHDQILMIWICKSLPKSQMNVYGFAGLRFQPLAHPQDAGPVILPPTNATRPNSPRAIQVFMRQRKVPANA